MQDKRYAVLCAREDRSLFVLCSKRSPGWPTSFEIRKCQEDVDKQQLMPLPFAGRVWVSSQIVGRRLNLCSCDYGIWRLRGILMTSKNLKPCKALLWFSLKQLHVKEDLFWTSKCHQRVGSFGLQLSRTCNQDDVKLKIGHMKLWFLETESGIV
jgi:hypothetical protein